jgi:hypothetical protein
MRWRIASVRSTRIHVAHGVSPAIREGRRARRQRGELEYCRQSGEELSNEIIPTNAVFQLSNQNSFG